MEKLTNWLIAYIRHRDAHACAIKDIKVKENIIEVNRQDVDQIYFIELDLESDPTVVQKVQRQGVNVFLVTLNNLSNIEVCAKKWQELEAIPNLRIIFINPLSGNETRWMISPYTHSKICDRENLKNGIIALSQSVDYVTLKELRNKYS